MEFIVSKLSGRDYSLIELEDKLKPLGYSIGGNWDYHQGSFDYKLAVHDGYYYFRLPFHVIEGVLDTDGAVVRLDQPFILHHKYHEDSETDVPLSAANAVINQFQSPIEKDAEVEEAFVEEGQRLVEALEQILL